MTFSRRALFQSSLAAVAPALTRVPVYRFQHDAILGTSLDLSVSAPSAGAADAAHAAMRAEIERLCAILSTYHPDSEISRRGLSSPSPDLARVLSAYQEWASRTSGVISMYPSGKLNVDALGKAYMIDRAAAAAMTSGVRGLLLNIGGDIVTRGEWPVGAADGSLLTRLILRDAAVATSGISARGRHIVDPRTGRPAGNAGTAGTAAVNVTVNATVIAGDAVTANALSTALCVLDSREGLRLVAGTRGAECLIVTADGRQLRSPGFAAYERPQLRPASSPAAWPKGYEVGVTITLKEIEGFGVRRPYVAIWAEDMSGKLVRNISVMAKRPRWLPDLRTWWNRNEGSRDVESLTEPTRPPGQHRRFWDGLDDHGQPVPAGTYRIAVETNREHGSYAKETATVECDTKPFKVAMKPTGEFEASIEYGPKASQV